MINQLFLILGVILITIGFSRMYFTKDNSKIIYRYIPRSFSEDQENPPPLSDLYGTMFSGIDPKEGAVYQSTIRKI
jgi:hypothetical protein